VIARGLVSEDIDATYTISDLKREYDDVMTIRSVDAMDGGLPHMRHWQVGAG
jgi:hypothetical protein